MTTQKDGPAFPSARMRRRQELAEQQAAEAAAAEPAAAPPAVGPGVTEPDLAEQVLRLAWDLGLNVGGRERPRGVKGKVRLGCFIGAETDQALREANSALGGNKISDLVDEALRHYLPLQGFRVAPPGTVEAERRRQMSVAVAALAAQSSAADPDRESAG